MDVDSDGWGGCDLHPLSLCREVNWIRVEQLEVEVQTMERRVVKIDAVRRSVMRSTKASAQLEGRAVPAGFVRSERVERFLEERRQRG